MIPPAEDDPRPAPPPPTGALPQLPAERPPPPKLRDAAFVLPVFGALLLLPPMTDIFMAPLRIGGIPLIVLYIFGVWLGLILVARWLAHRLRRVEGDTPPGWPAAVPATEPRQDRPPPLHPPVDPPGPSGP